MADKTKELKASISLVNEKLNFRGSAEGNDPVSIDYFPPLGDNLGYTSLELLLLSLSSCVGSSVLTFLRRMNRHISSFEIYATGTRREEHPLGFRLIRLEIKLGSPDATAADLEKVISLSEEKYCPVYSMIKGNCEVIISYVINT